MRKEIIKKRRLIFLQVTTITLLLIFITLIFFISNMINKNKNQETQQNSSENQAEQLTPDISSPEEENLQIIPTTYLNNITNKDEISDEALKIVLEYMDLYYKQMQTLEEEDMTYLFTNPNSDTALMNQTAISLLIQSRKLKHVDLSLHSAKYDLNIISVSGTSEIKITLTEDNYLNFTFMKEEQSKVYGIENNFTLVKVNDEYKIQEYKKVQDFYVMISNKYSSGGITSLNQIKQDYMDIIIEQTTNLKSDYQIATTTQYQPVQCDNQYDRQKAYEYAIKWVNTRNPEWSEFDGNNCQNYVSQILNAGGIPHDHYGEGTNQWKFYSSSYNTSQTASGYVYTWTSVTNFAEYARNNEGFGLCSTVDENLYYAEVGDVIHVGYSYGPTRHALISMGPYTKNGQVQDILVNSNTINLENYPISAYAYPYTMLIKVNGYND